MKSKHLNLRSKHLVTNRCAEMVLIQAVNEMSWKTYVNGEIP